VVVLTVVRLAMICLLRRYALERSQHRGDWQGKSLVGACKVLAFSWKA
jgi:hypothetical protein